jgi:6-pyruvoyltetrahydropterin/6-carboxytetrahydropterin synthase
LKVSVTRRYQFPASHRLHLSSLTEAENQALFGKCNNPYGHGHNYQLSVTICGDVDPETGLIVDRHRLDSFVHLKVLQRFSSKNINKDVAEFRSLIPTTENVAIVIAALLSDGWSAEFGSLALARIQIQETPRNGFELIVASHEVSTERRLQEFLAAR